MRGVKESDTGRNLTRMGPVSQASSDVSTATCRAAESGATDTATVILCTVAGYKSVWLRATHISYTSVIQRHFSTNDGTDSSDQ